MATWNVDGLREKLLRRTLKHAASNVPFYREIMTHWDRSVPLRLEDFPVIDASIVNPRFNEFLALSRYPDVVLMTGGTTGVASLVIRELDEYEMAQRLTTGLRRGQRIEPDATRGFVIHLVDNRHGVIPTPSHGQPIVNFPLDTRGHGELLRQLLEEGILVGGKRRRAVDIVGAVYKVRLMTAYLQASGFDGRSAGIESITTYGWHLTEYSREWLEEYWGASIVSRFGLSEFNTTVPSGCAACGGFHMTGTLVREYLSPDRAITVESGDAVLTLTGLWPFMRAMPRIRYFTNDVVRILPYCDEGREKGLQFLGRLKHCLLVQDGGEWHCVLPPVDVISVLEEMPRIERDPGYEEEFWSDVRETLTFEESPAPPLLHLEATDAEEGGRVIRIKAEACDEDLSRQELAKLEAEILSRLMRRNGDLEERLDDFNVRIDITVLPRGGFRRHGIARSMV